MTTKRKSPSKRDTPWFTVLVRWDNLAKLKEIAARNKAPLTQTVGRLINNEYDAVFPERRKEPDACTHNVRTT